MGGAPIAPSVVMGGGVGLVRGEYGGVLGVWGGGVLIARGGEH